MAVGDQTYILEAGKQQEVYDYLQGVGRAYPDDSAEEGSPQPSVPEFISITDLVFYRQLVSTNPTTPLGVQLSVGKGTSRFVANEKILQSVYAQLLSRDENRDGKIDRKWSSQDLKVSIDSAAALTPQQLAKLVQKSHGMAVLTLETTLAGPNETYISTAFVVEKIQDQSGGKTLYRVVADAGYANAVDREELSWRLATAGGARWFDEVKLVGIAPKEEIAVLEFVSDFSGLTTIPFGNTDGLTNQDVVLLAHSAGDIIPSVGSIGELHKGEEGYTYDTMHVSSDVQSAATGAPVFTLNGTMIGMVRSKNQRMPAVAVSYAERVERAYKNILARKNEGTVEYGHWGVVLRAMDVSVRADLLPAKYKGVGVEVQRVYEGYPAAKAGLRAGDIIVSVNGSEEMVAISHPMKMYKLYTPMADSRAGDPFQLRVFRPGDQTEHDLTVISGSLFVGREEAFHTEFGFSVYPISQSDRMYSSISDEIQGVYVDLEVEKDSDGDSNVIHGSLQDGRIITEVNGRPIADVRSFRDALRVASKAKVIQMTIYNEFSKEHNYIRIER